MLPLLLPCYHFVTIFWQHFTAFVTIFVNMLPFLYTIDYIQLTWWVTFWMTLCDVFDDVGWRWMTVWMMDDILDDGLDDGWRFGWRWTTVWMTDDVLDDVLDDEWRLVVTTTTLDTLHNDFCRKRWFLYFWWRHAYPTPFVVFLIPVPKLVPTTIFSEIRWQIPPLYDICSGLTYLSGDDSRWPVSAFEYLDMLVPILWFIRTVIVDFQKQIIFSRFKKNR